MQRLSSLTPALNWVVEHPRTVLIACVVEGVLFTRLHYQTQQRMQNRQKQSELWKVFWNHHGGSWLKYNAFAFLQIKKVMQEGLRVKEAHSSRVVRRKLSKEERLLFEKLKTVVEAGLKPGWEEGAKKLGKAGLRICAWYEKAPEDRKICEECEEAPNELKTCKQDKAVDEVSHKGGIQKPPAGLKESLEELAEDANQLCQTLGEDSYIFVDGEVDRHWWSPSFNFENYLDTFVSTQKTGVHQDALLEEYAVYSPPLPQEKEDLHTFAAKKTIETCLTQNRPIARKARWIDCCYPIAASLLLTTFLVSTATLFHRAYLQQSLNIPFRKT